MNEKDQSNVSKPGIYAALALSDSPEKIEQRSLETIDREAGPHRYNDEQWEVVRRMIHASADFSLLGTIRFSPDAVSRGVAALKACRDIFVDSNMIRAGISLARLRSVARAYGPENIHCHVADTDVAAEARVSGLPRSLFAVRKAKPILEGGIAAFGNAPVALFELNRMILEEGVRPGLVIAMPVGFVHVEESKRELMSLCLPFIAVEGRRGGSPLAVSAIHALCTLATRQA